MTTNTDDNSDGKRFAVILGATSLVGRYLVKRLVECGFDGWCLSRRSEPDRYDTPPGFAWKTVHEFKSLKMPAATTVFSLAPISALPALLERVSGADRLIALSSSSVLFKMESPDHGERDQAQALGRAEKTVQRHCTENGIAWTIFRPTLVYDPGRDRNVSAIAAFVQRYGVFPIVWPGTGHRQPIHADDVAQAMAAAAHVPQARGTLFDLPGGETLTYRMMVRRIFEATGRRPVLLYLPLGLARAAFSVWRAVAGANYSAASLERMNMDLTLDPNPVQEALGVACRSFRPASLNPPHPRRNARDPSM